MGENKRLFTGIPIPPAHQKTLHEHFQPYHHLPGVRWIPSGNYHITLHFIGDTSEETTKEFVQKLSDFSKAFLSFETSIRHFSFFPERKPYMIWAVADAHPSFSALCNDIHDTLNLPGKPPKISIPHITVARFKQAQITRQVHLPKITPPLHLNVNELILWESEMKPSGSRYHPLKKVKLK